VKNKLFTIGLPLAIAVCLFIGATTPPGTLTITGIPAEYEGKYISAKVNDIPKFTAKGLPYGILGTIANGERTIITNGEAKLPVSVTKAFKKPVVYDGNDTGDIRLVIADQVKSEGNTSGGFDYRTLARAAIATVSFEGGVADVKWDDAVSDGYITVTNIPENYQVSGIQVGIGAKKIGIPLTKLFAFTFDPIIGSEIVAGNEPIADISVHNGIITIPVPSWRKESGYTPFPQSGTVDVVIHLSSTSNKNKAVAADQYLFRAVPVTNGQAATLNFRQGAKQ